MNNSTFDTLVSFLPLLAMVIFVSGGLWLANWLLLGRHPELRSERRFSRQMIMLGLTLLGIVIIVLAVPIGESTRNQVIGLVGLLISGMIAFSSTNIVANLMAGLMLRLTQSFHTGDFIRIGDTFGRVTERGLLDTEVQNEMRELVSVPNTHLISNPHTVVRSSGAIVSATVSLGYDVHHSHIEALLLIAARKTRLNDPFVHILELGDFSVTYRVSGLLEDIKTLLTTRSNLNSNVLDVLHGDGVEIVSPTFMNQRQIGDKKLFIPRDFAAASKIQKSTAEDIAFDKAEEAEQLEKQRLELENRAGELEDLIKEADGDEKKRLSGELEAVREELMKLNHQTQDTSPSS